MRNGIKKVLITKEQIAYTVKKLGRRISKDYKGKDLLMVGVLKGGFVFLADLIRELTIPVSVDFIMVSSYGNTTETSGVVKILKDTDINMENKHVLIVEDLIDTGITLMHLKKLFKTRGTLSIKICTIFDKPSRRKKNMEIKYKGIEVPDEFIVGYGLDYAEKYRNLPDVCVLSEDIYKN